MKLQFNGIVVLVCGLILVMSSCTKTSSDTGAENIEGTYSGGMYVVSGGAPVPPYPDNYVVKIEARSGGSIRVSCISEPAVFETFTTSVYYGNGTTSVESQTFRIFYQSISRQLALSVYGPYGNASFSATKP